MKFLYVEDNPVNAKVMSAIIKGTVGATLVVAENAEIGLEIAQSETFDLIFMDLNLPGMSGYEAIVRLRETRNNEELPIIVVSADGQPVSKQRALDCGATDYIVKPVDVRRLKQLVAAHTHP